VIYITGATGFIGQPLCNELYKAGFSVCAITRRMLAAKHILGDHVKVMSWNEAGVPDLVFDKEDAIINLAGENVGRGVWCKKKKQKIMASRMDATEQLVEAIRQSPSKPATFIQASGIGYYGDGGDDVLTEESAKGAEFLSDVAAQAEACAPALEEMGVRVVMLRTAVVLGAEGGALPRMLQPFKAHVGGVPGSGRQFISWIHLDDEVRAILHVLKNQNLRGPFNLSAPDTVDARTFFKQIGHVLGASAWLPIPAWVIKLMTGQKGQELILSSKRVVPKKLLESGFEFSYPSLKQALENILKKYKGES